MRILFFISLLGLCTAATGQNTLQAFLSTAGPTESSIAESKIQSVVKAVSKKNLSDEKRLHKIFNRLQSDFLKKYEAHSGFDVLFSTGQFDCLTATSLFSLVLRELNYSFDIIETNYHIFLLVHTSKGDVLIETTDRLGGYVSETSAIAKRTADYRKNEIPSVNSSQLSYSYSFRLYQTISFEKLTGLLYYNQAVKAFNDHNWVKSTHVLEKANALYNSPRCEELGKLLLQSVMASSLEEKTKADCLVRLKNFWMKKSRVVVAN